MRPLPAPFDGREVVVPAVLPPLEAARLIRPALAGRPTVRCAPTPLVVAELRRLLGPAVRLEPAAAAAAGFAGAAEGGCAAGFLDPEAAAVGLLLLRLKEASARELAALSGLSRPTLEARLAALTAAGLAVPGVGGWAPGRGLVQALAAYLRLPARGLYRLGPGRPGRGAHRHLARTAGARCARAWGIGEGWVYWPEPKVGGLGLSPDGLGWLGDFILGVEVDRRKVPPAAAAAGLLRRARTFFGRFADFPAVYLVFTRRAVLGELAAAGFGAGGGLGGGRALLVVGLDRFGEEMPLPEPVFGRVRLVGG